MTYMHAYDPATGEIKKTWRVSGGEEDPQTIEQRELGRVVVACNRESRSTHYYLDGVLTEIPEETLLVSAKGKSLGALLGTINRFITEKPDGQARYDNNLKLNLMKASMSALAAGQTTPEPVAKVDAWIEAVQTQYFTLKASIEAATTMAELEAIDLSYAALEAAYGVAGTVLADPDIYTRNLATK